MQPSLLDIPEHTKPAVQMGSRFRYESLDDVPLKDQKFCFIMRLRAMLMGPSDMWLIQARLLPQP